MEEGDECPPQQKERSSKSASGSGSKLPSVTNLLSSLPPAAGCVGDKVKRSSRNSSSSRRGDSKRLNVDTTDDGDHIE